MAMTRRQKEILDFVGAFVKENGYSPSLEEIADELGLSSVSTVHKHVSHLLEKGLLRRGWNQNRSLEPVRFERRPRAAVIPLVGIVAAGRPIEAIEDVETLEIPESFLGRGETYALRVAGESMIDEGIRDGDFVIVERRRKARNGEVVVALIDGEEATLKTFRQEGARVRLIPANKSMKPMVFAARRVEITGVVTGVLRHFGR
ncbi:MAG: transcriptional repressor LexA [Acidobacteria bacterium]|nr:transcriptional repressor LexA [Acidobacteriota bacterium]MCZ6833418.1 transcriptional repressor LexA [Acidobacteriota bacterium]